MTEKVKEIVEFRDTILKLQKEACSNSKEESVGDQKRSFMKHGTELFSVAEISDAVTGDKTFPL